MGTKSWKQGILHSKTEWWVLEKGLGMLVTSNVSECSLWRTEVPPNGDTGGTSQARPPRALVYNCSHSCGKGANFISEHYNSTQTLSPLRCQGLKNTRTSTLHFTTKDLPLSVNCKRELERISATRTELQKPGHWAVLDLCVMTMLLRTWEVQIWQGFCFKAKFENYNISYFLGNPRENTDLLCFHELI